MIPIYGFLKKDTIGVLIMAYPEDTVEDLIQKLQQSAAIRVPPKTGMRLIYKEQIMAKHITVLDIGFQPLDHFFVCDDQDEHV